jgi:hypothetical protein
MLSSALFPPSSLAMKATIESGSVLGPGPRAPETSAADSCCSTCPAPVFSGLLSAVSTVPPPTSIHTRGGYSSQINSSATGTQLIASTASSPTKTTNGLWPVTGGRRGRGSVPDPSPAS